MEFQSAAELVDLMAFTEVILLALTIILFSRPIKNDIGERTQGPGNWTACLVLTALLFFATKCGFLAVYTTISQTIAATDLTAHFYGNLVAGVSLTAVYGVYIYCDRTGRNIFGRPNGVQ